MIKKKVVQLLDFVYKVLVSTKVFVFALALLIFQSVWMAFSAIYPLPFDEYYHVGLIKIYAQQWTPFIDHQSAEASLYGDITRMPSYLYHYLMSFPWRFLNNFVGSETALIICMRLINIALVVGGLILFRKLFLKVGISRRVINVVSLFFVVTPIVPFLAAHVNYDNAMFLLSPVVFAAAYRIIDTRKLEFVPAATLVTVGLVTVLIKNSFIPVFGITILVCVAALFNNRKRKPLNDFKSSFKSISKGMKVLTIASFAIVSMLFVERYGYNVLKYQNLWPRCETLHSESVCEHFMPWYRNNQNKLYPPVSERYGNPISFTQHWASKMARGYFAIFSHTPTNVLTWYEPFGPIVGRALLPMPIFISIIIIIFGVIICVKVRRKIWTNQFLRFCLVVSLGYIATLWLFNYRGYLSLGTAQAVQARYTYPVMLLLLVVIISGYNFLKLGKRTKTAIFLITFIVYAWGGGIAGWIIRSDSLWYWQNNTVISVNQKTQSVLKKVVWH